MEIAALTAEIVLTFAFLFVILGATDKRAPAALAPVAIGLCLTLIHLISIPVTNTSVNPARSTGPALFVGDWAVSQLWLFWVAPIVGALIGYSFAGGQGAWIGALFAGLYMGFAEAITGIRRQSGELGVEGRRDQPEVLHFAEDVAARVAVEELRADLVGEHLGAAVGRHHHVRGEDVGRLGRGRLVTSAYLKHRYSAKE